MALSFLRAGHGEHEPPLAESSASAWTRSLTRRTAGRPPPRQAIGQPYVWDGGEAEPDGYGPADDVADGPRRPVRRGHPHPDALIAPALTTERAVIGDLLRQLAVWCQIGACVARHTDDTALGEADIRNKAVAAGWCVDLFWRLVCPDCQQPYPVWSVRPPVERGRYRLVR